MYNRPTKNRGDEKPACAFILALLTLSPSPYARNFTQPGGVSTPNFSPPGTKNGENMRLRELLDELAKDLAKVLAKITLLTGDFT